MSSKCEICGSKYIPLIEYGVCSTCTQGHLKLKSENEKLKKELEELKSENERLIAEISSIREEMMDAAYERSELDR